MEEFQWIQMIYIGEIYTIQFESLVIDENVNRQLVRITLPSNSPAKNIIIII
jgi:hypothetical protein